MLLTKSLIGIPPAEAARRIRERIKKEMRRTNSTRILSLGGGVAINWVLILLALPVQKYKN
jgi:hypothetical protein